MKASQEALWQQALEELVAEVVERTARETGKELSKQEREFAETAILAYNLAFPLVALKMMEIERRVVQ